MGNQFGGGREHNRKEKEKREKKEKKKKGKKERTERKERKGKEKKGRGGPAALPPFFQCFANQGVGSIHAPRGMGFSYSVYFMLTGHSMAIGFGPNHKAGS